MLPHISIKNISLYKYEAKTVIIASVNVYFYTYAIYQRNLSFTEMILAFRSLPLTHPHFISLSHGDLQKGKT